MTDKETKPRRAPKHAEKATDKFIKVTLVRSPIGCPRAQRETVKGLGLRKLQSHAVLRESPAVLGMVRKITHLVKVETMEKP